MKLLYYYYDYVSTYEAYFKRGMKLINCIEVYVWYEYNMVLGQ